MRDREHDCRSQLAGDHGSMIAVGWASARRWRHGGTAGGLKRSAVQPTLWRHTSSVAGTTRCAISRKAA